MLKNSAGGFHPVGFYPPFAKKTYQLATTAADIEDAARANFLHGFDPLHQL